MYLRCRTVLHSNLSDDPLKLPLLESRLGLGKDGRYSQIEEGRYYVAFAIAVLRGVPHVFIRGHKRPKEDFIMRTLACFDVLDSRVSRFWCFQNELRYDSFQKLHQSSQYMAIREWFEKSENSPLSFWEKVFELEDKELAIMNQMADLMEIEYAQSNIESFGRKLENGLVACPTCATQDDFNPELEMARCKKCDSIFHIERDC